MKAPFPYLGGKSTIADVVWRALGRPRQYIEPFCGSAAVLLSAPEPASLEVAGDANCYIANFWRCVKYQPEACATEADYPVSHVDLDARLRPLLAAIRAALGEQPPRLWVYAGVSFALCIGLMLGMPAPLVWTVALVMATVWVGCYADERATYRREAETWRQAAHANARAHAEALLGEAAAREGLLAYERRAAHLERVVAACVKTPEAHRVIAEGCQ